MFVADYFIRKEGEARVVDQQQVVRDHLDQWLKCRPSADVLTERGILGRGLRFAFARDVVDQFLRARAQAQAAEIARIPPGNFQYTDRIHELLADVGGESKPGVSRSGPRTTLQEQLCSVRADRELAQQRLKAAEATWSQAAVACQQAVCTGALHDAADTARSALELLEAHRTSTGQSLSEIFADIQAFQRLAARKSCLESIIKVVDKTDKVRKAVFACRGADSVPLDMLEEIPVLCESLPSRSKAIGARRVQFLIGPLRTLLVQELQELLKKTCQWPVDPSIQAQDDIATVAALFRVCADLYRTQAVNDALHIPRTAVGSTTFENDDLEGSWVCSALSAPLIARFRHHFWRPDSELCKMDKPEWAFKYLLDVSSQYGDRVGKWMTKVFELRKTADDEDLERKAAACDGTIKPGQEAVLAKLDLPAGLALSMASEARLFVRARMLTLAQPEARPTFLHTLERLIRFRRDIGNVGGSAAQIMLFGDFDSNRPLVAPCTNAATTGKESSSSESKLFTVGEEPSPEKPPAEESSGFMGSLSHLRKPESSPAAETGGLIGGLSHLRKEEPPVTESDGGLMGSLSHLRKAEPPEPGDGGGFMGGLSHLRKAEPAETGAGGGFMGGLSHLKKETEPPAAEDGGGFLGGLSHLKKEAAAPSGDGGGFMASLSHLRKAETAADTQVDKGSTPEDKSVHGQIGKVGANLMAGLSRFGNRAASAAPASTMVDAVEAGLSGGDRLLSGLSTFADTIADDALEFIDDAGNGSISEMPVGFLDIWAAADSDFINEKLMASLMPDSAGWRPRPLNPSSSMSSSGTHDVVNEAAVDEPEVAEFATLFKDLFDKACGRADCLTAEEARKLYSVKVLDTGLQKTVGAIKERWNATKDPVKEAQFAALLVETLQDMCLFLDNFLLSKHMDASVDEANATRLSMIDKLADGLVDVVRPELRRLQSDACVFSYSLGPPLSVFAKRLRASLLQKIARTCVANLADMLLKHLLRHPPFTDKEDMAQFLANCRDDLGAVLTPLIDASDLTVVQPLWDGCSLLALSDTQAGGVLASLRHVAKCSPSHGLDSLDPGEDVDNFVEPGLEVPVVGDVLRQRRAEVFARAGIKELPVMDAIAVLSKRPELVGAMSDLQEAVSFGMMQDLLPVPGVAQATFQMGVGALQQGVGALPTNAAAAAASAATSTLQTGLQHGVAAAAELKSFLPGRLIGQVRSTLSRTDA